MSNKVFITGVGIVTSIGIGLKEVKNSIINKKSGISNITNLNTFYKDKLPLAEIKHSNKELVEISGLPLKEMSRTALLGIIAAKEAILSSGINLNEGNIGFISATSVGGMDKTEWFYDEFYKDSNKGKLKEVVGHDCFSSTELIAEALGINGYLSTVSTACSSSVNSIMFGARLIKNGFINCAIVGGTDAITRFTLNGFNTLMILDKTGCKPFDKNRAGLTLGEGSAYVVLESEESIKKSGKTPLCELTGYANANDAYHQTASSPEGNGAYLAMSKALLMSKLKSTDISCINAHGTGTQNNDLSEGIGIKRVFGENIPYFSSTKAFTGHTLGAAGSIETVLSTMALTDNLIYPNLNFNEEIEELGMSPVKELITDVVVENVLSNSFGFGGNNSSLILSKIKS